MLTVSLTSVRHSVTYYCKMKMKNNTYQQYALFCKKRWSQSFDQQSASFSKNTFLALKVL